MPALPRAACRVCERSVPLRVTGQLREHNADRYFDRAKCPGSGTTPPEVARLRAERRAAR